MKRGAVSREQRVLVFVGGLAILTAWVYAVYIIGPLQRETSQLGRQIREAREQLRILEVAVGSEAALEEKSRRLHESVRALRGSLTPEAELPSVIELLTELASQTQVKVQTIFPQRPAEPMEPTAPDAGQGSLPTSLPAVYYKEVPIQIDALAGYHQLGTFLNLVETADKPMRLLSLRISANPKEPRWHRVKLLVQSYLAVPEPAPVEPPPSVLGLGIPAEESRAAARDGQARGSTAVVLRSFDAAFGLAQDRGERPTGVEPRLASLAHLVPSAALGARQDDPSPRGGRHPERGLPGQGRGPSRRVGALP